MKVGVAICTIGRQSLSRTLECLVGQPYDQISIVSDKYGNLSKARNQAWKALSDCDVIAFTDDDCIPDSNWVEEGRWFFEHQRKCSFMQGKVYGGLKTSPSFFFVGANFWVRTAALKELNGFDEEYLMAGGCEDVDFGWRLLELGRECLYNNRCKVRHEEKSQHKPLEANRKRLASKFPDRFAKLISFDKAI